MGTPAHRQCCLLIAAGRTLNPGRPETLKTPADLALTVLQDCRIVSESLV